ncbi:MAG: DUF362 domain-containing protein [bacterium]
MKSRSEVTLINADSELNHEEIRERLASYIRGNISGTSKTVLIKPNFLNDTHADKGVTTSITLLKAFCTLLKDFGIKRIIVGEESIRDTAMVFKKLGVDILKQYGAEVVNFETAARKKVSPVHTLISEKLYLPDILFECDTVISAAKLKTHDLCTVTLSVKNLFGLIPHNQRMAAHIKGIDECIVEIYEFVRNNFKFIGIIDGMVGLEGRLGPITGNPVKMNLIYCGQDGVAVDSVAALTMGKNPREVNHIRLLEDYRLGCTENINIKGSSVEKHIYNFKFPPTPFPIIGNIGVFKQKIFKKSPIWRKPGNCTKCKSCIKNCPAECISLVDDQIIIYDKKCISCLCCCESCKYEAMDYKMRGESFHGILKSLKNKLGSVSNKKLINI